MSKAKKHEDLIYDVGMHVGEDTDFYLKKGFRVVAFEANPELAKSNKIKFAEQIKSKQLVIVSGAIIENPVSGTVKFYCNKKRSIWGTVDPEWVARNEKTGASHEVIEVNAINFSKCLEEYGIPYYMKIDIEGADLVCLRALKGFELKPSYVSVESEKVSFPRLIDEIDLLESLGYNQFLAVQQWDVPYTKVPNPAREGGYLPYRFVEGASGLFGRELNGVFKNKEEILEVYKSIFKNYERFGDDTFWRKNKLAKLFMLIVSKIIKKPIPGWYDTHAKHFTAC
jgi:FkbM family methyltransferase